MGVEIPADNQADFFHLADAAFFAIARRFWGLSFAALALPPFLPPLVPISRMIDFLNSALSKRDFASVLLWVVCVTIDAAI